MKYWMPTIIRAWLLTVAMLVALAWAKGQDAPLDVKGEGVKVVTLVDEVSKIKPLSFTAPDGAKLYIWQDSLKNIELSKSRTKTYTALPKGEFTVNCTAIDKDFEFKIHSMTVSVGSAPLPPDPPNPPDPPPVDEITKNLQAAYAAEDDSPLSPNKATALKNLVLACQQTALAARKDSTLTDALGLRNFYASKIQGIVAPGLPHVRGVVVRYLDKNLPLTAVQLTPDLRESIGHHFDYIAASLGRVK